MEQMVNQAVYPPHESELRKNASKLIILGVLLFIFLVVIALIWLSSRQNGKPIAGSSFTLMTSLYDLKTPLGVATDRDENIYVANTGGSEIIVFDRDGNEIHRITSIRDAADQEITFPSPYGIAVDDERNKVYICDFVVRVLDKDGQFQYDLIPPPGVAPTDTRPNEVALLGDRVLITSMDGIYVFDSNGNYVEKWGSRGKEVGQYDFPNGIAADPNTGNIFVVDTNNWRVVSLNQQGKVRWTIGNQNNGTVPSPFHLPRSVAVGPDGLVYISDIPDRVVVLNQDGELVSVFGERGTGDAQFNFPEGLTVTASDRLYFADRENNRVQVWQLSKDMPVAGDPEVQKFKKALKKY